MPSPSSVTMIVGSAPELRSMRTTTAVASASYAFFTNSKTASRRLLIGSSPS